MHNAPHPEFYGWRLLIPLWFIYFSVIGFSFYGAPVLFPYMIEDLAWTRGQLSLGLMTSMLLTAAVAPLCAASVKRFGARHTMFVGSIIAGAGMMTMLTVSSITLYVIAYGLIGTGVSLCSNIPVQTVITHWFNQRRGTALGLVLAGASMGGFVAPLTLSAVIRLASEQWRFGWLCLAVVIISSGLASLIFVRNEPADLGQYPDGLHPARADAKTQTQGETRSSALHRSMEDWTLQEAVRTRQFWLVLSIIIGSEFIWQLFVAHGPLHLADRGFTSEQYSIVYGSTVGLSIIGRLGTGFLADRVESRTIFLITTLMAVVGAIIFWLAEPGHFLTWLFPVFSGVAFGALVVLWPTIVANYWGSGAFAEVNGVIFPVLVLFNASVAPLSGFLYDSFETYLPAFGIAWAWLVVAFIAALALSPPCKPITKVH